MTEKIPPTVPKTAGKSRRRRSAARRRPPVGAAPGTLVPPPYANPTAVRILRYDAQQVRDEVLASPMLVRRPPAGDVVTWIDVNGIGDHPALEHVAAEFGLHRLALADIVNVPQRARVESYGEHLLIITRPLCRLDTTAHVESEQVSLVLGPGYVLSFQEKPGDPFDRLRERLHANNGALRSMKADYLLYAMLDAILDTYYPVVEGLGERLEQMEDLVEDTRAHAGTLAELHGVRRELFRLGRAARWHRDLVVELLRSDRHEISDGARVYLRDARDHAVELLESAAAYRDVADSLMELHLSLANTRLNEVMKVLTVISAVFIPLTLIASVYGMNFQHMPELQNPLAYPVVLGVMAAVAITLLVYFRRLGWLGRNRDE